MFKHSVPVPRSYKLASKILQQVKENGENLKTLLYQEKNRHFHVQAVHALIFEALKHEQQMNDLIVKSKLLITENRFDPWLARILITELLWGKQTLPGESKPIKVIREYETKFREILESLGTKESVENVPVKALTPRYIRINTLKTGAADAVRYYQDEGWHLIRCTSKSYDEYLKQVENLGDDEFIPDFHVKVVFTFSSATKFHDDQLYLDYSVFLQNKATCLAPFILAPTPGSTVLDMCAAPGMKTTHLAAIMKNEGTVYAIEQHVERYKTLCTFIESSGATCVKPINGDAAKISKVECPNVDYVLLDPSCSGSGIARAEGNDHTYDLESGRVAKLAALQAKLLRHALNEFRTAKRVVYSTCSLYSEENEAVVEDVVRNHKGSFRLVSAKEKLNNNWNNIGDPKYVGIGEKCIYARPESDYTCGFFIAVFENTKVDDPSVGKDNAEVNKVKNINEENTIKHQIVISEGNKNNSIDIGTIKRKADSNVSNDLPNKKIRHNSSTSIEEVYEKKVVKKVRVESIDNVTDFFIVQRKPKKNTWNTKNINCDSQDNAVVSKEALPVADEQIKKRKKNDRNAKEILDDLTQVDSRKKKDKKIKEENNTDDKVEIEKTDKKVKKENFIEEIADISSQREENKKKEKKKKKHSINEEFIAALSQEDGDKKVNIKNRKISIVEEEMDASMINKSKKKDKNKIKDSTTEEIIEVLSQENENNKMDKKNGKISVVENAMDTSSINKSKKKDKNKIKDSMTEEIIEVLSQEDEDKKMDKKNRKISIVEEEMDTSSINRSKKKDKKKIKDSTTDEIIEVLSQEDEYKKMDTMNEKICVVEKDMDTSSINKSKKKDKKKIKDNTIEEIIEVLSQEDENKKLDKKNGKISGVEEEMDTSSISERKKKDKKKIKDRSTEEIIEVLSQEDENKKNDIKNGKISVVEEEMDTSSITKSKKKDKKKITDSKTEENIEFLSQDDEDKKVDHKNRKINIVAEMDTSWIRKSKKKDKKKITDGTTEEIIDVLSEEDEDKKVDKKSRKNCVVEEEMHTFSINKIKKQDKKNRKSELGVVDLTINDDLESKPKNKSKNKENDVVILNTDVGNTDDIDDNKQKKKDKKKKKHESIDAIINDDGVSKEHKVKKKRKSIVID